MTFKWPVNEQSKKHSNDGPIIAVQIENEYGVYEQDSTYLPALRQILIEGGITEVSQLMVI